MANVFKKIGRGIKKFAKSKVGKVVLTVAGVAAGATVAGKLINARKAAKALQAGKGLMQGKKALKKGKGLFAGLKNAKESIFSGGVDRLSKKIKRKAARQQARLDRKQAKLDGKKSKLEQSLQAAKDALGVNGAMTAETQDTNWLDEMRERIGRADEDLKEIPNDPQDSGSDDLPAEGDKGGLSDGAKKALVGAGVLGAGVVLAKTFGWIK